MAASNRFEFSHEPGTRRVRYDEGVSIKEFCEELLNVYNNTSSLHIPLLIHLFNQPWKPGKTNITSWVSGTAYLTNTQYTSEYEENTLAILILYGWSSPSYKIYDLKGIIWWGEKSDYSDAYITWSE